MNWSAIFRTVRRVASVLLRSGNGSVFLRSSDKKYDAIVSSWVFHNFKKADRVVVSGDDAILIGGVDKSSVPGMMSRYAGIIGGRAFNPLEES